MSEENDNYKLKTYINGTDINDFNPVAEALGIDPCKKRIDEVIDEFRADIIYILDERLDHMKSMFERVITVDKKWEKRREKE